MTIAVLPLEYFPPLHSVALMAAADQVLWADTWPYRRQTRQNRSKLRNPNGWQWISLPMWSHQHGRPMHEVKIDGNVPWHERQWRAFMYNYRSTMYFEYFEDDFAPLFDTAPESLQTVTEASTRCTCAFAQIDTPFVRASEHGINDLSEVHDVLDADRVWVAHAHQNELDAHADHEAYTVLPPYEHPTYRQNFDGFETGMAAIDCIFNYGPEATRIIANGLALPAA